jgi:hypothetical protein
MNRRFTVLLAASLALASAACKSAPSEPPKASTGDFKGERKIRFKDEGVPEGEASGPGVIDYVAAPFENIVYLPWKLVGGAGKGAVDGVAAGFGKDDEHRPRMPAIGLLFSPLNAILGLLTGAAEGVADEPVLVGVDDSFSHAMGRPLRRPTTIWWY